MVMFDNSMKLYWLNHDGSNNIHICETSSVNENDVLISIYQVKCNFLAYWQVISAIPRHLLEMARATVIDKTNFLAEQMFPLSSETSINLLKMKNKDYYRLLINSEKTELKAKPKWAHDLRVDQIPLESFFSEIQF